MLSKHESAKTLQRLFRRSRVVEIDALYRTLKTRSRMSVFRRLRHFNYLTSYSHAGGFYTLTEIPRFDENGLWRYGDIGFSKAGTLKNTIAHLVDVGDAGRTQGELRQLLRVRVHDTALHLVREERIDRQRIEKKYLYVSAEAERAAEQIAARRELLATATAVAVPLPPSTIIEILLEVINASQAWVAPAIVADRLTGRGLTVSTEQVEVVFTDYGLDPEKKTAD